MKIYRKRVELHPDLFVVGHGPDRPAVSIGAALNYAQRRAELLAEPGTVEVREYGEAVYRVIRDEHGIVWTTPATRAA